jgi:hypothetical protein
MDNYEAIAYAKVALRELQRQKKEINEKTLGHKMLYLMDIYSEKEILKISDKD